VVPSTGWIRRRLERCVVAAHCPGPAAVPVVVAADRIWRHAAAPLGVAEAVGDARRASWAVRHAIRTCNPAASGSRHWDIASAQFAILQHRAEQACHLLCQVVPPSAVVMVLLIVGDERTVVSRSRVRLGAEVWWSAAIGDYALVKVGVRIDRLAVDKRLLRQGIVALDIVIQVHIKVHLLRGRRTLDLYLGERVAATGMDRVCVCVCVWW
jgi:hypothetical protein